MKRALAWTLLLALAYLIGLGTQLPAHRVAAGLAEAAPATRAVDAQGNLWRGQALLVDASGRELGPLRWELRPLSLITLRLELALEGELEAGGWRARLLLDPLGGRHLQDINGALALAPLLALADQRLPVEGRLHLRGLAAEFDAGGAIVALAGEAQVEGLTLTLGRPTVLGDFSAALGHGAQGLSATVRDREAPLRLEAEAVLGNDGSYRLQGRMTARDPANRGLTNLLAMAGRADAQGWIPLNLQGRWTRP